MDGEFSRVLPDPLGAYTGVLLQQGRALVDAEWNEQVAIQNDQLRCLAGDLIARLNDPTLSLQLIKDPVLSDDPPKLAVEVFDTSFYVQGVRCRPPKCRNISLWKHPSDAGPLQAPYVISVHAWERTVNAAERDDLADKALEGADSAIRSKIVWELQLDAGDPGGTPYLDWITGLRSAIKTRHNNFDRWSPSLYRIEVIKDGATKDKAAAPGAVARFAWTSENPTVRRVPRQTAWAALAQQYDSQVFEFLTYENLNDGKPGTFKFRDELKNFSPSENVQFFRMWDGHRDLPIGGDNNYIRLDDFVSICFDSQRKYRRGDSWLIPYRGRKNADANWLQPTGRHYFAIVFAANTLPRDVKHEHEDLTGLVVNLMGSADPSRRTMPAKALARETTDPWLQKWLGTALLSEVAHGGFDEFWWRLNQARLSPCDDDDCLFNEAKRIWRKSQQLDLALNEASLNRRHMSVS